MRRVVLAACDDEDRSPVAFARSVAPWLDARVVPVRVRSSDGLAGGEADPVGERAAVAGARVEHGAASAVAVVPRGHGERPLGTVGVGLLPTSDSLRALRAAAALARAAGAPLLVLTVLRRS